MAEPNVVIIKSDQHNARCMGINGHPQVKTPNIDELARGGVHFTRAFTQSPICTPSRYSGMSGQYVHNHGVYGLVNAKGEEGVLPDALPLIFQVFNQAGYYTGIVGHVHVEDKWIEPWCDQYRNMYGPGDPYSAYLDERGLLAERDDRRHRGKSQHVDGYPSVLSFEDSCDGYCYRSFCDFLDAHPDGQPFLYELDPLHPHQLYVPVQEFWDLYEGVELELPPSADEDLSTKPPHQQWMIENAHANDDPWVLQPKTYEAGRLRKLRGYYGCVSQADHMVGLVRQKLAEIGELENTIVIYTTDHGEFALEHGFLEKASGISYDAVTRIPYIWSWPGGDFTSNTVEELVEAIDTFPTLCALTGVEPPDTIDGLDISAMLRGDVQPLREFAVTEFPLTRVIRTKEWKLVHRPRGMFSENEDAGELYHVSEDPWEMNNLYDDPQYYELREDLRRRLFEWTQWTTRYHNAHPLSEYGADHKITLATLKRTVEERRVMYL